MVVPERAVVTSPGPGGCGDYATNIALQLARPAGRAPRQVAEILRTHLRGAAGVSEVAITGPGFLNISLNRAAAQEVARTLVSEILKQSSRYGYAHGGDDTPAGHVIALRVPHDTRAEVLADTLVRIIATQGGRAEVQHAEPVDLRPVPAPEDPAPSVTTPPAGRCSTPRPMTGPGSPRTISSSVRAIPSSVSGTPTPVPGPSAAMPPRSASTVPPATYPKRRTSSRHLPSTPGSSVPPRSTAPPTGSPGISSPPPTPCSTSSTRCCRSVTRNPRPPTVPGSRSPKPPGRCWPVACPCSASVHPNISETADDTADDTAESPLT